MPIETNRLVAQLIADLPDNMDEKNKANHILHSLLIKVIPLKYRLRHLTEIRTAVEKLSLLHDFPFRVQEITDYLYPNNEKSQEKTENMMRILREECHILYYEDKGYHLDKTISLAAFNWIKQNPDQLKVYKNTLIIKFQELQRQFSSYPESVKWYRNAIDYLNR